QKAYELRVVCIGSDIITFRIDVGNDPNAAVDWRRAELCNIYSLIDCPARLGKFCMEFLRQSSLTHGVFDFAVTPEDRTVFFECNPSGQWHVPASRCGVNVGAIMAK